MACEIWRKSHVPTVANAERRDGQGFHPDNIESGYVDHIKPDDSGLSLLVERDVLVHRDQSVMSI